MSIDYTPRTWVAGEICTAAMMNAEVRDAFVGLQATETPYSPAWTASTTNPTIGNGSIVGQFLQVGKQVDFLLRILPGTTTTFGSGTWSLTLPIAPSVGLVPFYGYAQDSSAATEYPVMFRQTGTNVIAGRTFAGATAGSPIAFTGLTATTPFTWAATDVLLVTGRYQIA